MSLRDELLTALQAAPASGYTLHVATGAPPAVVERELSRLVAAGAIRRVDNVYHVIDRPPTLAVAPTPTEEPDMSATKTCRKCEQDLPLDQFTNDSRTPDGKGYLCGGCRGKGGRPVKAAKPAVVKPKALREVVAKHAAKPNGHATGEPIAAALALLKVKRAALDQAIAALEGVAK